MIIYLRIGMSVCLFLLGICSCLAGISMMLSRQHRQMLRNLSAESARVSRKAVADAGLAPLVEAFSGLIQAVNQLVRTSAGVGAFLCLSGGILCWLAFLMLYRP
ncbi:MAG TPA: hypothetical protein ENI37_01330 [Chloroflexi bacterium]|nr:hypothetical protein [Chloroflexota bacterium]